MSYSTATHAAVPSLSDLMVEIEIQTEIDAIRSHLQRGDLPDGLMRSARLTA
jgi:hypothetical protein